MNIHEYQAKEILAHYHIPIPPYGVATHIRDVEKIIRDLSLKKAVIKIQVHAGGRGKAGGVKFAEGEDQIVKTASGLLGMKMINQQTGPQGVIAHKVLISEPMDILAEYYLGAVIDREKGIPILLASPAGGMDIEEVALKHPSKILKLPISLEGTLHNFHLIRLCKFMNWDGETARQGKLIASGLAKAFIEKDASLLEINPLIKGPSGGLWALDAKLTVDDNALFRQKEIASYYDASQSSSQEEMAKEFDLAYIPLEGNIGCMVNGAGLAMATMDLIHFAGGMPANFLDVGGGASKEKVAAGFKIILCDPHVKAILVNIFGGIMNCKTLAEGIIQAIQELDIKVPLVVRMEGTNVEEGKKILERSQLTLLSAEDLKQAAKLVVEASEQGNS